MLEIRGEKLPVSESVREGVTSKDIEEYYLQWQKLKEATPLEYRLGDNIVSEKPYKKSGPLKWLITMFVLKGVLGFGDGKKNSQKMAKKNGREANGTFWNIKFATSKPGRGNMCLRDKASCFFIAFEIVRMYLIYHEHMRTMLSLQKTCLRITKPQGLIKSTALRCMHLSLACAWRLRFGRLLFAVCLGQ